MGKYDNYIIQKILLEDFIPLDCSLKKTASYLN